MGGVLLVLKKKIENQIVYFVFEPLLSCQQDSHHGDGSPCRPPVPKPVDFQVKHISNKNRSTLLEVPGSVGVSSMFYTTSIYCLYWGDHVDRFCLVDPMNHLGTLPQICFSFFNSTIQGRTV